MSQQAIYNSAIKSFIVSHPDADWSLLCDYLKDLADSLLTEKPSDFWDGIEVSVIDESKEALRDLVATNELTVTQHRAIIKAQEILSAAQERLCGNAQPLLTVMDNLNNNSVNDAHLSFLSEKREDYPTESSQRRPFDDLYQAYLNENSVNMAKATISDHNTIRRRLSDYIGSLDMLTYTREDMTELRACLIESGNYADASINKILQKVSAVVNWGVNNGLVNYDYTKGLKLKGAKSQRRAFTDTEL
ncbi:hypothetical protein [Atlantibacter subterraneus]|uniref:hypothetical protein n=1 Tax=Atlantibacter subterraneus TaxID=255519 RepID=UPI002FDD2F45